MIQREEAAHGREIDSKAQTTDWELADVTFDPSQRASRRTSVHIETRPTTVTFDPMTSSHGNISQSERRASTVALESSFHDNLSRSSIFDPHNGSRGNQQTFTDRPLTSGGCGTEEAAGVEELGEGGEMGGEVCDEGEQEEGEREDHLHHSHQSGVV